MHIHLQAERLEGPGGEARWRLSDVIGAEEGLGVECLSGSGAIASAYNRAFAEVRLSGEIFYSCSVDFAEMTQSAYDDNTAEIFAPS